MALIGIRELRQKTAEILRHVQQDKQTYVITQQGRPIALLLPLDQAKVEAEIVRSSIQSVVGDWSIYRNLANELRQKWPVGKSTESLLDETRR